SLYVVDKGMRLLGVVTAEDASNAIKNSVKLEDAMLKEPPSASPDALLHELFEQMSSSKLPISIIDANGRLKGVVIKGAVLAALAVNSESEAREHHESA